MIVLDANILIGLHDPADPNHARAERLLTQTADEALAVPALTLAEFLVRPAKAGASSRAEAWVATMGLIICPLLATDARHLARVRAESGLRMPDAVALWLAQSSSAALMTVDDRLAGAAEAAGVEVIR